MIYGLFLDSRAWNIDFLSSPFWKPDKYGIHIDLHNEAFNIPKQGIDKKYKFVIATEVWEIPMQKTLKYLRSIGVKVFLAAREPIKYGELIDAMFSYERFKVKDKYYFKPDAVFAAGNAYSKLWDDKTKTYITGYPRWDWYIDSQQKVDKKNVAKKYNLDANKKWIFFPDYPPYHYKKVGGKDVMIDLFEEREATIRALIEFSSYSDDYQVVVKIHPSSMKPFLKGTGKGNEVSGCIKKYYKYPEPFIRVVGDIRTDGNICKEILVCSDLLVGYNSTMMLEASFLNKPVIQATIGVCKTIQNPYTDMYKMAETESSLADLLKLYSNNTDIFSPDNFIKEQSVFYIHHIDGECCQRMCAAIKKEII